MVDFGQLTLFLYITARMTGFVQFSPLLGRQGIPATFRGGFILILSVFSFFLTDLTELAPPATLLGFAVGVMLEMCLGFLLGMVTNFFFFIPQMAGQIMDTQMGMTMNQIYDTGSRANMSQSSMLINILMTLLFFAANGHHTLLRMMVTSGNVVAYGGVSIGTDIVNVMLELFMDCVVLGVKLCMPILAAELLGQLGMGILMKVIPQINVFSINIELKVIIGLGLLLVLIAPFSEVLLKAERTMLNTMSMILSMTG
ncbi:MAG: flagellar biosynthetic protein FliR [Oscillibacter sp.]|nr:flagellar biosynthetic protein FliR [Oscillibacter sp.]